MCRGGVFVGIRGYVVDGGGSFGGGDVEVVVLSMAMVVVDNRVGMCERNTAYESAKESRQREKWREKEKGKRCPLGSQHPRRQAASGQAPSRRRVGKDYRIAGGMTHYGYYYRIMLAGGDDGRYYCTFSRNYSRNYGISCRPVQNTCTSYFTLNSKGERSEPREWPVPADWPPSRTGHQNAGRDERGVWWPEVIRHASRGLLLCGDSARPRCSVTRQYCSVVILRSEVLLSTLYLQYYTK